MQRSKILFTILLFLAIGPGVLHACPGCGAAMSGEVSHGFNMSILFMMSMPFLVVGSIVFGILIIHRNQSPRNQSDLVEKDKAKEESSN